MNPARSLGPAIVAGYPQHLWIYIVAPVAGALVGVLGWKGIRPAAAVQASLPKG
jgi:aquaporin Z